jgi:hypothetical protein
VPQVLAWECQHTGKLFKDVVEYKKHLTKLASERRFLRREERRRSEKEGFFRNMRNTVANTGELEAFLREHWELFVRAHLDHDSNWTPQRKAKYKIPKLVYVKITLGDYGIQSNMHAAPLGKRTNWSRVSHLPCYYMGWHGKIELIIEGDLPSFSTRLWEGSGITVSGGGGSHSIPGRPLKKSEDCYWSSITLWADDWHAMHQVEMIKKLEAA